MIELKDRFDNLTEAQKVSVWNDFADANNYNKIFENTSDNLDMCFIQPSDLLNALDGGCYEADYEYFLIDDYGTLITFSYIEDCPEFDWDALEKWLISWEYDLDNV